MFRTFRLYQNWWKTWGTFPVRSWLKAAQLFKAAQYERAIALYRRGLETHALHPARICARLDLAYCLYRVGRLKEAEEELRIAANLAPQSRDAHLRLAQLQLWTGHGLEAAWTVRRALRSLSADVELATVFFLAAYEGNAPAHLMRDAIVALKSVTVPDDCAERVRHRYEVAQACLLLAEGKKIAGRRELSRLAGQIHTSIEAILAYSQVLLRDGKISFARQQLRRGMLIAPQHPRILSLLAESYLKSGLWYNPDYAVQLAQNACQLSGWTSPREMHVLAESYYHLGDKMAALVTASRAKEAGNKLLGSYHASQSLDRLIEDLSSGTLA